ncbi:MAG: hydrogenase maturation protease, partial [Candidatus Methylomirabilales bacterium]
MSLREDLQAALRGRVAVVGIGNPDLGDDAAGVRLAEALAARGLPDVLAAERTPEHWAGQLMHGRFDSILLLDAVDAGLPAGDVLLMDATRIQARFPQISTHRLSLGLLARLLEGQGTGRVRLLGIQPASLAPGAGLSPAVRATVHLLTDLLRSLLTPHAGPGP